MSSSKPLLFAQALGIPDLFGEATDMPIENDALSREREDWLIAS
jgi:hypothetical protein